MDYVIHHEKFTVCGCVFFLKILSFASNELLLECR